MTRERPGRVVIGTHSISGDLGATPPAQVEATLTACVDAGFFEFDTAPDYGRGTAETTLGNFFDGDPQVLFHTKAGNHVDKRKDYAVNALAQSLEQSLERLRTTTVGTLFLHNPREEIEDYDAVQTFGAALKIQGTIERFGLSVARNFEYHLGVLDRFDALQVDHNLLRPYVAPSGGPPRVIFGRSPLASGLLSGRVTRQTEFSADDQRGSWCFGPRLDAIITCVDAIRTVANDLPIEDVALRYALHSSAIDRVVVGIKSPDHVDRLLQVVASPPLDNDLLEALHTLQHLNFGLNEEQINLGF